MALRQDEKDKILELYLARVAKVEICKIVHHDRKVVYAVINKAIAEGKVPGKLRGNRNAEKTAELYELICREYALGTSIKKISEKAGICASQVANYIRKGKDEGKITERYKGYLPEDKRKKREFVAEDKPKYREVPSTLAPGETVNCNASVAAKCVYGSDKGGLCSYSRITGHCRSLVCKHQECTCFSKISKTNPRLMARDDVCR